MGNIYLDNAATTPIAPEVVEVMHQSMLSITGNPSSIHSFGRIAKAKLEMARKNIASVINASPAEIFFTSGGTEADNLALQTSVYNLDVKRIISSKIEHHAVLNTIKFLKEKENVQVEYVNLNTNGSIDLNHLSELLSKDIKTLVSLMHVNNETGTVLNIDHVAKLCKVNNALFHSDTIQSLGYYNINVKELEIDFIACSAHKFHGPKGVGFLYIKQGTSVHPLTFGGNQERGFRPGTENIHSIIGLEKALLDSNSNRTEKFNYVSGLKNKFIELLDKSKLDYSINGSIENVSPAILNISFKMDKDQSMILFNMDLSGIAISGGSACTSGSNLGSHVLKAIGISMDQPAIRFSFSKMNTIEELEATVKVIEKLVVS
jgi:cysteine desulfurase